MRTTLLFICMAFTFSGCTKDGIAKKINYQFIGSWNMKITKQIGALDSLSFSVFSNGIYTFQENDQFSYNNLIGGLYRGTFQAHDFGPSTETDDQGNNYPGSAIRKMEIQTTDNSNKAITLTDLSLQSENRFTASGYNQRVIYECEFTRR